MTRERLGPYRIVKPLGAGGMGEVFEAVHEMLGRPVALKLLKADRVSGDEAARRFRREMQIAAALSHPNLVRVYDGGTLEETPFIVMELVGGEPLSRWLQRDPRPSVSWCLKVARQVADGLACLHEKDICHRDVKPENILLEKDGTAKLGDFGLVRTVEGTAITADGGLLGTLPYMAPELLKGDAGSHASDLWALGCVLYTMLTGRGPLVADTPGEWFHAITQAPIRPLSEVAPEAGEEVSEIVAQLLEREPAKRLSSAVELSTRLAGVRPTARRSGGHAPLKSAGAGLKQPRTTQESPASRGDPAAVRTSPGGRPRNSGPGLDVTAGAQEPTGRGALVAVGVIVALAVSAVGALVALTPAPPPSRPSPSASAKAGPLLPGDPRWAPELLRRVESLKGRDPREAETALIDGLAELGRARPEPPWPPALDPPAIHLTGAIYTRIQDLRVEIKTAMTDYALMLSPEGQKRERAFAGRFRRHAGDLRSVLRATCRPGVPHQAFFNVCHAADLTVVQESRMLDTEAARGVETEMQAAIVDLGGNWRATMLESCDRTRVTVPNRALLRRRAFALFESELEARKTPPTTDDADLWHELVTQTMSSAELAKDVTTGRALYEYAHMRRSQMPRTAMSDSRWQGIEHLHRLLMALRR